MLASVMYIQEVLSLKIIIDAKNFLPLSFEGKDYIL